MTIEPKMTTFTTIAPLAGMDIFEKWEQFADAGSQFDGTVGKGRAQWSDTNTGRVLKRMTLVCGAEPKTITLEVVDTYGARWLLDKRVADTNQTIVVLYDVLLSPGEHLELKTVGAILAMRAGIVLRR